MPEQNQTKEQINLDEIAAKIKDVPKRPSLESIIPSLIHAVDKNFVVEEDGHFKEFKKADDESKHRFADVVSEELFYILATKYFNIPKEKFQQLKEFNKFKDEFGEHINDAPLLQYMGINRNAILKIIKGLEKFNYETVLSVGSNAIQKHGVLINSKLLEPIKTEHISALKDWIVKNSEGRFEREIKELVDIQKLKQYFIRTVNKDYGEAAGYAED